MNRQLSDFVLQNYDFAASLFIKELIHLVAFAPECIMTNSFEISERKMAFATLPHLPLCYHDFKQSPAEEEKEPMKNFFPDQPLRIKEMISDLLAEIGFLSEQINVKDCSSILTMQGIYKFKDREGPYFLADWLTAMLDSQSALEHTETVSQSTSRPSPKEIFSLGLNILELNGIPQEDVISLKEMEKAKNALFVRTLKGILSDMQLSDDLKSLVGRMLDSNAQARPQFKDFPTIISSRKEKQVKSKTLESNKSGDQKTNMIIEKNRTDKR